MPSHELAFAAVVLRQGVRFGVTLAVVLLLFQVILWKGPLTLSGLAVSVPLSFVAGFVIGSLMAFARMRSTTQRGQSCRPTILILRSCAPIGLAIMILLR